LAGANYGQGLARGKMGKRFFEGTGKMELRGFGSDSEYGFAEAVDAVGSGFEGLGNRIVRIAGDDDLDWMMREERGSQAVGGGEKAVLRGDAGKGFQSFLGESAVAIVASEGVHSNKGDGGDGIGAGRWRILEGFAADVESAHGSGVGRTIEEAAAFGVTVA